MKSIEMMLEKCLNHSKAQPNRYLAERDQKTTEKIIIIKKKKNKKKKIDKDDDHRCLKRTDLNAKREN